MMASIYKITNIANGKTYVGQAVDKDKRFKEHVKTLKGNYHCNQYLQRAWFKYGAECFKFEVLEECSIEQIDDREQFWIDTLDCVQPKGYNIAPVAGSMLNYKHTKEARANMSKAHIGEIRSEEFKNKMSERLKGNKFAAGHKHTAERIEARAILHRGIPKSEDHKAKIAAAQKGRTFSEDHKRKLSKAAKNRRKPIDENLKISSL